jgi:preprotein translocase subunit SecG
VRKFVVLLVIVAILLIGVILYRSRSTRQLNVDPDAAREIEKAKQR